jgi:hypothetical protein
MVSPARSPLTISPPRVRPENANVVAAMAVLPAVG